jgi:hypothetical protein
MEADYQICASISTRTHQWLSLQTQGSVSGASLLQHVPLIQEFQRGVSGTCEEMMIYDHAILLSLLGSSGSLILNASL